MLKALQSVLVLMLEGPTEVLDPMLVSVHPTYHITPFLKPDSHYMYNYVGELMQCNQVHVLMQTCIFRANSRFNVCL